MSYIYLFTYLFHSFVFLMSYILNALSFLENFRENRKTMTVKFVFHILAEWFLIVFDCILISIARYAWQN